MQAGAQTDWGSALHGLRFQIATRSLLAIDMEQYLNASWQPQMLLLYQVRARLSVRLRLRVRVRGVRVRVRVRKEP